MVACDLEFGRCFLLGRIVGGLHLSGSRRLGTSGTEYLDKTQLAAKTTAGPMPDKKLTMEALDF